MLAPLLASRRRVGKNMAAVMGVNHPSPAPHISGQARMTRAAIEPASHLTAERETRGRVDGEREIPRILDGRARGLGRGRRNARLRRKSRGARLDFIERQIALVNQLRGARRDPLVEIWPREIIDRTGELAA